MNVAECNEELLECARYGEDEDLETLLKVEGVDVNYKGGGGNTALHRAAANGEVGCMGVLKKFDALHLSNETGNLPLHWAVQNKQLAAVKFLMDNYELDMLDKNVSGKSVVTEAFGAQNADILEAVLSHSSATEERLVPEGGKINMEEEDGDVGGEEDCNGDGDGKTGAAKNAVLHEMFFLDERQGQKGETASESASETPLKVRELPIAHADNPFGTDTAPEDDTTGLAIWPAAILLARWLETKRDLLKGKVVAELGAGCGLPALAAALYCEPKAVYVTDIHRPTLDNAVHNVLLNRPVVEGMPPAPPVEGAMDVDVDGDDFTLLDTTYPAVGCSGADVRVVVRDVNWANAATYPAEQVDVMVGSDLVYDKDILGVLLPALDAMLAPKGSFLYIAPNTGRAGMPYFLDALKKSGYTIVEHFACSDNMFRSPLQDLDLCVLHFYDLSAKVPHTCYHFQKS